MCCVKSVFEWFSVVKTEECGDLESFHYRANGARSSSYISRGLRRRRRRQLLHRAPEKDSRLILKLPCDVSRGQVTKSGNCEEGCSTPSVTLEHVVFRQH